MSRPRLEVAEIFREHGPAWRKQHQGHISLDQLKVMSAIENCRTARLGGHVLRCDQCKSIQISYNSCRNRHCPRCQSTAAKRWLDLRLNDLLPVEYYHVVFTLPCEVSDLAYSNKRVMYNLLFKAASETLLTIAADPKHLGAKIGMTMVLHTWGSALTHHPHVHCIVPGGGLSLEGNRWVHCKPNFFLPVRVLSRLFRRLYLEKLNKACHDGQLQFFGQQQTLMQPKDFDAWCKTLKQHEWVVYAKQPFAGPQSVLQYLSRYTHRVAIANSRLLHYDSKIVTFKWKDYRAPESKRYKTMTLTTDEFIRRYLIHVLPNGLHRIRHYGWLANTVRTKQLSRIRECLDCVDKEEPIESETEPTQESVFVCPHCGTPLIIIDVFERGHLPRAPPQKAA